MLIGKDFDKIEFSFFGLNLLEPNAFIGDSIILITALFLASKLRKFDTSNPFFKNWRYFFLLFGSGMFLGGVGHLMFNYFGFYGKYIPWLMGILAVYFIEKAMVSLLKNNHKLLLNKVILFKLFLFILLEILVFCFIDMSEDHSIGLRVPAINSTTIADHLLIPICSFRKNLANIDIKKGQEKKSALVIASVIKVKDI